MESENSNASKVIYKSETMNIITEQWKYGSDEDTVLPASYIALRVPSEIFQMGLFFLYVSEIEKKEFKYMKNN